MCSLRYTPVGRGVRRCGGSAEDKREAVEVDEIATTALRVTKSIAAQLCSLFVLFQNTKLRILVLYSCAVDMG